MAECSTKPSPIVTAEAYKAGVRLRKRWTKDIQKENPDMDKSDVRDRLDLDLEFNGVPDLVSEINPGHPLYKTHEHEKNPESEMTVYDIINLDNDEGYSIMYLTVPEKKQDGTMSEPIPRVVTVFKDGYMSRIDSSQTKTKYKVSMSRMNDIFRGIQAEKSKNRAKLRIENKNKRMEKNNMPKDAAVLRVTIPGFMADKTIDNYMDTDGSLVFEMEHGSQGKRSAKVKFTKENAMIIDASLVNDMSKSEDILRTLMALDGDSLSAESRDFLLSTLRGLTDTIRNVIPEMIQVISTNEKENVGKMVMEGEDKGIWVNATRRPASARNGMTAAEVYVHELLHAALEYAQKNHKDLLSETMADVEYVYKKFLETVTVEDFMPSMSDRSSGSVDRTLERKIAEQRLEQLRDGQTGMNEFIVMSKTNLDVKKVLEDRVRMKRPSRESKTLWQMLVKALTAIYDVIYNFARHQNSNMDGYSAMTKFITEISDANNLAIDHINEQNVLFQVIGKFTTFMNEGGAKLIKGLLNKISPKKDSPEAKVKMEEIIRLNEKIVNNEATWFEKVRSLALTLSLGVMGDDISFSGSFETWISLIVPFNLGNPEGALQQFIRVLRSSDAFETAVEKIGLLSGRVEYESETAIGRVSSIIVGLFDRELTEQESVALTKAVIDTDLGSLLEKVVSKGDVEEINKIAKIMTDSAALQAEISATETAITALEKNAGNSTFMINQAKGLGSYMITGKSSEAQMMNAYMIVGTADGSLEISDIEKRNELGVVKRALVDKLATLYSIKHNDSNVNAVAAKMINENSQAVIDIMKYDKMAKAEFKVGSHLKPQEFEMHQIKGHNQKIEAGWISTKVTKTDKAEALAEEEFVAEPNLTYDSEFTVFVNTKSMEKGYTNEGIRTTNSGEAIHSFVNAVKEDYISLEDQFDKEKQEEAKKKTQAILKKKEEQVVAGLKQMRSPNYSPSKTGTRPVFSISHSGTIFVTDLDINVDKRMFEEVTETKNRVETVVAKTFGRALDLNGSVKNSKKMLDILEIDANENFSDDAKHWNHDSKDGLRNWSGGKNNNMEYVKIGPYETNSINKEIWPSIPRYLKEDIVRRHYNNVFREIAQMLEDKKVDGDINDAKATEIKEKIIELMSSPTYEVSDLVKLNAELNAHIANKVTLAAKKQNIGGSLDDVLAEISKIKKTSPYIPVRRNLVYHVFGSRELSFLPEQNKGAVRGSIVKMLKYVDVLWKHIIKVAKVNIVIRDIPVLMYNVLSNVLLAVIQGRDPFSEIKAQISGLKHLERYKRDHKRSMELQVKVKAKTITTKEKNELFALTQAVKNNPVMPLINAGLYTSATEELSNKDLHKESYFDKQGQKLLDAIPGPAKAAFDFLYLTKDTQGFKVLLSAMQSSDFAARYAGYYRLINQGASHDVAIKKVLDNQINYPFSHGKMINWLNARGLIMFSKFFEGIQRVIRTTSMEKPFNVLTAVLAGGFMFDDSPLGDNMYSRGITGVMYNPLDVAAGLFEKPAAFQIMSGDF